jgi:hypothetical protein
MVYFRSRISLLIFCLDDLSIDDNGVKELLRHWAQGHIATDQPSEFQPKSNQGQNGVLTVTSQGLKGEVSPASGSHPERELWVCTSALSHLLVV